MTGLSSAGGQFLEVASITCMDYFPASSIRQEFGRKERDPCPIATLGLAD